MKTLIRVVGSLLIFAPFVAFGIILSMNIGPIHDQFLRMLFALGIATPPYILAKLFDNWFKRKYQPHLIKIKFIIK